MIEGRLEKYLFTGSLTLVVVCGSIISTPVKSIFTLLIVSLFCLYGIKNVLNNGSIKLNLINKLALLFYGYNFLMYVYAFINGLLTPQLLIFNLTLWSSYLFFLITNISKSRKSIDYLTYSILLFVGVNLALYLAGFKGSGEIFGSSIAKAKILQLIGIEIDRVKFALASGLNSFGVLCGFLVILSLRLKKDSLRYCAVFTGILALLMTDTRGAIGALFVTLLLYLMPSNWINRLGRYAIILTPVIIILVLIFSYTLYFNLNYESDLFRGQLLLSGREIVWMSVLDVISPRNLNLVTGYGIYGQSVSEIYKNYEILFTNWDVAETNKISLHNYFLQTLIDLGIIGITLLILIYKNVFESVRKSNYTKDAKIISCLLIYLVLAGITDLSINLINYKAFLLFMAVIIYAGTYLKNESYILKTHEKSA